MVKKNESSISAFISARPFTLEDMNSSTTAVFQLLKHSNFLIMATDCMGEEDLKFRMPLVQMPPCIHGQTLGAVPFHF